MRFLLSLLTLFLASNFILSQSELEVEGQLKVTELTRSTTASENVVRTNDGYLAMRKYEIGDFAQGGIVFWVDESGEHGLVCAKQDNINAPDRVRWYAGTYGRTNARGDGPFSGEMNTTIIIAAHVAIGDDELYYAARFCAELLIQEGSKKYGDWYLPSSEELTLMYTHRFLISLSSVLNGGSGFAEDVYWSSTESSDISAWTMDFRDGIEHDWTKINEFRIRAIRAF